MSGARVSPEEFRLSFFEEMGFVRKKCSRCGAYFWTLDESRSTCGDAPCESYSFQDLVPAKGWGLRDARRAFLGFFESKGHSIEPPRPVVARWREDLYLTIASIVVFQPHVTSGISPPPANPLVIAQPCIRLEDVDHVGITLGRHMSIFEMGGHHAFNYPEKYVYWKEETVRYAFEFFTKVVGVPPEAITFKESWWEGGGNAGPCFEVAVGGLEVATLVFMKYRVGEDGRLEEMPLKVVDTGYGLERIAWLVSGKPTAFDAVYGDLVIKYAEVLGGDYAPPEVLREAIRHVAGLDPEKVDVLAELARRLAPRFGFEEDELLRLLRRSAALYALLDHSRALAFMLADGVVPSSSGEGYLARLLIRRAARLRDLLGANVKLAELVDLQLDFWGRDYPHIPAHRDYILRVIELEERRYRETLVRGLKLVERRIKRKKRLTVDDLVELYDSHGVPPDVVAEVAAKLGVRVEIPRNFYEIVAARHGAQSLVKKFEEESTELPRSIVEAASRLPETRRLFHEDPYMRVFRAKPLWWSGRYLVLEATAFYPRGGGQDYDTGVIRCGGEEYKVLAVYKVGGVIVHVLNREFRGSCSEVEGIIDWDRRFQLMRHHSAVHLLLAAARSVLGDHVWQAGAEKRVDKARLDVTHYEVPSYEEVREIEELLNRIVASNLPVKTQLLERNEAERIYGYRLYQGGAPLEPMLRVVEVPGWDAEACFGTHVSRTAEVGPVKIVSVSKLQDGVIRFELVAGDALRRYAGDLESKLAEAAKMVGAKPQQLIERLRRLTSDYAEVKRLLSTYRSKLAEARVNELLSSAEDVCGVKLVVFKGRGVEVEDDELYRDVIDRLSQGPVVVVAARPKDGKILFEVSLGRGYNWPKSIDLRRLVEEAKSMGGRGGGKRDHITGMIPRGDVDEVLAKLSSSVRRLLEEALCGEN